MNARRELAARITAALQVASELGTVDGEHHKAYVLDQMVRCLTGCPTVELVSKYPDVHGNKYTYQGLGESDAYRVFVTGASGDWDEGVAP